MSVRGIQIGLLSFIKLILSMLMNLYFLSFEMFVLWTLRGSYILTLKGSFLLNQERFVCCEPWEVRLWLVRLLLLDLFVSTGTHLWLVRVLLLNLFASTWTHLWLVRVLLLDLLSVMALTFYPCSRIASFWALKGLFLFVNLERFVYYLKRFIFVNLKRFIFMTLRGSFSWP